MSILTAFTKVKSVDEIVAVFDKTLVDLEARIKHDEEQALKAAEDKAAEIAEHAKRLLELGEKEAHHVESKLRATRVIGRIRSLLD